MNWTINKRWNVFSSQVSSKGNPFWALPCHTHANHSTRRFDNWLASRVLLQMCVPDGMEAPHRAAIRNLFHCSFRQKSCMLTKIETMDLGFASSVPKESYNEHMSLKISFQLQRIILPSTFMSHLANNFSLICRMNFLSA